MRTESKLHKIRIVQHGGGTTTWGVTIPASLDSWFNILVTIKESGNCLILESGTHPVAFTIKDLKSQATSVEKVKF